MKLRHMILLLALTLSVSLMSFKNPTNIRTEAQAKMLNPVAVWTDPNGIYPAVYFYDLNLPMSYSVNHRVGGAYSLLWWGDVISLGGGQIYVDGWVYWSGTPYNVQGTLNIVEM
ncbi:MAG: hypothetical protein ACTHMV_06150 [Chitinophagaceae bacterium]